MIGLIGLRGKTTLLNVIAGKQSLSDGTVTVGGTDLTGVSEADKQQFRRDTVVLFFSIIDYLTNIRC